MASGGRVSASDCGSPCDGCSARATAPPLPMIAAAIEARIGVERSRASGRRAARRCDSRGAAPASSCRRPGRARRPPRRGAGRRRRELARSSPIDPAEARGLGSRADAAPARGDRARFRSRTRRCTPACAGSSSRCQSSSPSWFHSRSWAISPPMNSSFLPGCAHMKPK